MAYTANYSASDLSSVTIDLLVGIGVSLVAFASIFGLIMAWKYAKKNVKL